MKAIPDIPTTVMAQARGRRCGRRRKARRSPQRQPLLDPSVRERWNDYGIGLLLQGDLKGAEAAFLKGHRDGARRTPTARSTSRARDPGRQRRRAIPMLEQALQRRRRSWRRRISFWATALKTLGRYDEALAHLRPPRPSIRAIGWCSIRSAACCFSSASSTTRSPRSSRVLQVDPEDLQAHYNLMLCYQGRGDAERAAREQALYERFKADESAQAITGPYRLQSPDDNNERQQIHEHRHARRRPRAEMPARAAAAGEHGPDIVRLSLILPIALLCGRWPCLASRRGADALPPSPT